MTQGERKPWVKPKLIIITKTPGERPLGRQSEFVDVVIRPEDRPFEKDEDGEFVQKPFERSKAMSEPFLMTGALGAEARYPYQVRTYTDVSKAPVCQNFPTYIKAAERACELMKNPKCPLTDEFVVRIMVVKMAEPVELVTVLTDNLITEELAPPKTETPANLVAGEHQGPGESEEAAGAVTL